MQFSIQYIAYNYSLFLFLISFLFVNGFMIFVCVTRFYFAFFSLSTSSATFLSFQVAIFFCSFISLLTLTIMMTYITVLSEYYHDRLVPINVGSNKTFVNFMSPFTEVSVQAHTTFEGKKKADKTEKSTMNNSNNGCKLMEFHCIQLCLLCRIEAVVASHSSSSIFCHPLIGSDGN